MEATRSTYDVAMVGGLLVNTEARHKQHEATAVPEPLAFRTPISGEVP